MGTQLVCSLLYQHILSVKEGYAIESREFSTKKHLKLSRDFYQRKNLEVGFLSTTQISDRRKRKKNRLLPSFYLLNETFMTIAPYFFRLAHIIYRCSVLQPFCGTSLFPLDSFSPSFPSFHSTSHRQKLLPYNRLFIQIHTHTQFISVLGALSIL